MGLHYKPDPGSIALLITLGCPESDLDEVFQRLVRSGALHDTVVDLLAHARKVMRAVAEERS